MHWGGGRTLTGAVRTHHGGLVLVDHHFFSFRNYADARDKTRNSKAAEVLMISCLRALGRGRGGVTEVDFQKGIKMSCGPRRVHHNSQEVSDARTEDSRSGDDLIVFNTYTFLLADDL